LIIYSVLEG